VVVVDFGTGLIFKEEFDHLLHAFWPVFALHYVVTMLFANAYIGKQTVKQALRHSCINPHYKLSNSCSQQEHNINRIKI
jgi:hypothetical protein